MLKIYKPPYYMNKFTTVVLSMLMATAALHGQVYSGDLKFDGEHKNEVSGYLEGGKNIVTRVFVGPAVSYTRHFTPRWSTEGAFEIPIGKGKYGIYAKGIYHLPLRHFSIYFSGKLMYNRYTEYHTNEYAANLSALLQGSYFDINVGESFIRYTMLESGYTEPLTLTFGMGVNIRHRANQWNLGLYIRNYDDFYYENWNINWGVRWHATLNEQMKLFGELNVRPAGSTSQLATRYETSMKVGVKYVW